MSALTSSKRCRRGRYRPQVGYKFMSAFIRALTSRFPGETVLRTDLL
jgi:hypothetical protein